MMHAPLSADTINQTQEKLTALKNHAGFNDVQQDWKRTRERNIGYCEDARKISREKTQYTAIQQGLDAKITELDNHQANLRQTRAELEQTLLTLNNPSVLQSIGNIFSRKKIRQRNEAHTQLEQIIKQQQQAEIELAEAKAELETNQQAYQRKCDGWIKQYKGYPFSPDNKNADELSKALIDHADKRIGDITKAMETACQETQAKAEAAKAADEAARAAEDAKNAAKKAETRQSNTPILKHLAQQEENRLELSRNKMGSTRPNEEQVDLLKTITNDLQRFRTLQSYADQNTETLNELKTAYDTALTQHLADTINKDMKDLRSVLTEAAGNPNRIKTAKQIRKLDAIKNRMKTYCPPEQVDALHNHYESAAIMKFSAEKDRSDRNILITRAEQALRTNTTEQFDQQEKHRTTKAEIHGLENIRNSYIEQQHDCLENIQKANQALEDSIPSRARSKVIQKSKTAYAIEPLTQPNGLTPSHHTPGAGA